MFFWTTFALVLPDFNKDLMIYFTSGDNDFFMHRNKDTNYLTFICILFRSNYEEQKQRRTHQIVNILQVRIVFKKKIS